MRLPFASRTRSRPPRADSLSFPSRPPPSSSRSLDFASSAVLARWNELSSPARVGLSQFSEDNDASESMESILLTEPRVFFSSDPPAVWIRSASTHALSDTLSPSSSAAPSPGMPSKNQLLSAVPPPRTPPNTVPSLPEHPHTPAVTPTSHPLSTTPPFSPFNTGPDSAVQRCNLSEITALKHKFNELDAEGRGFLTRSQFFHMFQSIMNNTLDNNEHSPLYNFAQSLFYSTNADRLHLREFVTGVTILGKGTEEERLRYLFHMYDTDNSENLNVAEIEKVFHVMSNFADSHTYKASESLEAQSLNKLRRFKSNGDLHSIALRTLNEHDQDCDGVIGFDDFAKWCAQDPVVKTWLDKLCFDTARGIHRLKVENEKNMLTKELENLGFFSSDLLQKQFENAHMPSSCAPILPPAVANKPYHDQYSTRASSSSQPEPISFPLLPGAQPPSEQRDFPSSLDLHSLPPDEDYFSALEKRRSRRTLTDRAIGSFEIDFPQLTFQREIGSGSFAVVWKCTWLDSPVAVKVFKSGPQLVLGRNGTVIAAPTTTGEMSMQQGPAATRFVQDGESFDPDYDDSMLANVNPAITSSYAPDESSDMAWNRMRFLTEVSLLKSIRHPNCLLYMGACVDPRYPLCIVSSLINGGSLFQLLHGRGRIALNLRQKFQLVQDIALGMRYLHGRQPVVLHRDLKSQNILVEEQNDGTFKGTIIDFGLSKLNTARQSLVPGSPGGLTGSVITMAPEVMDEKPYMQESDVYSYGIVCWEIFCGRIPFGSSGTLLQILRTVSVQGRRPAFLASDEVPEAMKELIQACWQQNATDRPHFSNITEMLRGVKQSVGLI